MAKYNIKETMNKFKTEPPMKSFLWRVELPDLSKGNRGGGYILSNDAFSAVEDLYEVDPYIHLEMSKRITNISIPFVSIETDKAIIGNSYWYYGKQNDIGSISFEINEYEDGLSHRFMDTWKALMINPNGTYNPPVRYKRDIKFFRLNSTKSDIIVHTYKGYFVSAIADVANDYESNDIVKFAINLTGDSVETEIFDIAGVVDDPSQLDQLKRVLSIESILPTLETALGSRFNEKTGLNLPTIF